MAESEHAFESRSVDDTRSMGRRLGAALRGGDAVAVIGELGAGKTQLVKGIAVGAGVRDARVVNSPTFVIVNEYAGRIDLYHVDAYRLSGSVELEAIGIDEMFGAGSAVVIEWADRVQRVLPEDHLRVRLDVVGDQERRISFAATGDRSRELLADVLAGSG
ncbi:MAG: tRNA (adenosine(37)-N6)-threonylcarbamoyltransferase complex ATPase subunit type 1 TsaE [Phycisphaerales bacterium]|nr:MAG: tRNA (adenosine(37)-N6)-threonylcarbamoyltransferase complex ATPase subunit type 1 TsaE [Phycisphaerales bacterium]